MLVFREWQVQANVSSSRKSPPARGITARAHRQNYVITSHAVCSYKTESQHCNQARMSCTHSLYFIQCKWLRLVQYLNVQSMLFGSTWNLGNLLSGRWFSVTLSHDILATEYANRKKVTHFSSPCDALRQYWMLHDTMVVARDKLGQNSFDLFFVAGFIGRTLHFGLV